MPSLSLEVYAGAAAKHLARMAGEPGRAVVLHDVMLLVGLLTAGAAVVLVSRAAQRAVDAVARLHAGS
jgi:hypothetical protein